MVPCVQPRYRRARQVRGDQIWSASFHRGWLPGRAASGQMLNGTAARLLIDPEDIIIRLAPRMPRARVNGRLNTLITGRIETASPLVEAALVLEGECRARIHYGREDARHRAPTSHQIRRSRLC